MAMVQTFPTGSGSDAIGETVTLIGVVCTE